MGKGIVCHKIIMSSEQCSKEEVQTVLQMVTDTSVHGYVTIVDSSSIK